MESGPANSEGTERNHSGLIAQLSTIDSVHAIEQPRFASFDEESRQGDTESVRAGA